MKIMEKDAPRKKKSSFHRLYFINAKVGGNNIGPRPNSIG